jgi:hypothetical protein
MSEETVNTEFTSRAMTKPRQRADDAGKPDGTIDPAGAGWFLQREREKRGETLEDAGEATGIHPYHVEAIEFGDMTRMPTRMEALEMISAMQYLGFDPEPLVNHYIEFLPRLRLHRAPAIRQIRAPFQC